MNTEKKKYFITGVAGFLGSHLADRLVKDGHHVVGCDNFLGGYRDNIPEGVEFYELDLINREEIVPLLKDVDVVYHCAATAYEGLSVFSPHVVTQNIYGIAVSLISACIAQDVKRFVLCSSMARYGTQDITPFTEDMIPKPQDPYGIAKYASELTLANLAKVHGMEYVIAVPHNIIGPRQKYDDPYRNVASIMINLMLQGRQPVIYGDGEQKRCFSFVSDVVEPLIVLGESPDVVGEVINIGPDEGTVTIKQLAEEIASIINFKLDPEYMPGRPQEVKYATCSANKARKLLNYKTTVNLHDGLVELVEYIRNRGVKPFDYHLPLEIVNDLTPKTWKNKLF